jgi:hypothetical protein
VVQGAVRVLDLGVGIARVPALVGSLRPAALGVDAGLLFLAARRIGRETTPAAAS